MKTKKLKVKSKVSSIKSNVTSIDGGKISLSNEQLEDFLNVIEKKREPYWFIRHKEILEILNIIRGTLNSMTIDEFDELRAKMIRMIDNEIHKP